MQLGEWSHSVSTRPCTFTLEFTSWHRGWAQLSDVQQHSSNRREFSLTYWPLIQQNRAIVHPDRHAVYGSSNSVFQVVANKII
jgi:hypothetical protein